MVFGRSTARVVEKGIEFADNVGERKQDKLELEDAPGHALRTMNEADVVQPGFWGFARAGWRPFVLWGLSAGLVYNVLISPFLEQLFGIPHVDLDENRLEALLLFLATGVGVREVGKHFPNIWKKTRGRR